LTDKNLARRCVRALELDGNQPVLEIGPGRGMLTQILVEEADVTAVEIDPELAAALQSRFSGFSFSLIQGDFVEADLKPLEPLGGRGLKVIGNLPYAVTSPIIQKLLDWPYWTLAVIMIQKEVADRILAKPGGKDYGVLSISVQARCRPERAFLVPPSCFRPAPKVQSAVLRLRPLEKPEIPVEMQPHFFTVVRAGFAHRRKTILNSMGHELDRPSSELRSALEKAGIDPSIRAETLGIPHFKKLTEILYP
jgi:16S rRNA (adenine1518-N6/adenine1519-N6)-dimethyltransferase